MAIVVFNPQDLEQERLKEEGAKLQDFFQHGSGAQCNLSSLYFQPWYDNTFIFVSFCSTVSCASASAIGNNKIVLCIWLIVR
jgi:hypothetical protein